jgi:hypothetical protein
MADYRLSLNTIHSILQDPAVFSAGRPLFTSVPEMDRSLISKGFALAKNESFGPDEPDARQLIYQGPNDVIVKIKTRGYAMGPRAGRATLSIEAMDGRGTGWENVLFKVDGTGKIIAKNLINEGELARLPDGNWGVKRGSTGKVEPIVKFEVIQGGLSDAFDKQAWADRGHLDLPKDFNPAGAKDLGK